jgi:CBS domain-containing protein
MQAMNETARDAITSVSVRDLMRTDIVAVEPTTTVRELVRTLAEHRIGGTPVLDAEGRLVGIVTTTDLVRLAAEAAEVPLADLLGDIAPEGTDPHVDGLMSFLAADAWGDAESLAPLSAPDGEDTGIEYEEYTVADIMRPARCTVKPDDSLESLARALLEAHVHRAPVLEAERLVGIVTTFDVLRVVAAGGAGSAP